MIVLAETIVYVCQRQLILECTIYMILQGNVSFKNAPRLALQVCNRHKAFHLGHITSIKLLIKCYTYSDITQVVTSVLLCPRLLQFPFGRTLSCWLFNYYIFDLFYINIYTYYISQWPRYHILYLNLQGTPVMSDYHSK